MRVWLCAKYSFTRMGDDSSSLFVCGYHTLCTRAGPKYWPRGEWVVTLDLAWIVYPTGVGDLEIARVGLPGRLSGTCG